MTLSAASPAARTKGVTVSFEPTGLSDSDRMLLFGEVQKSVGSLTAQVEMDNETPYGGFGYVRKMRDAGQYSYEAWIILKIKFTEESQATATKEKQISWNCPTLNGRAAGIDIDGSGKQAFRVHASFTSLSAAKAWINTVLNVSAATT